MCRWCATAEGAVGAVEGKRGGGKADRGFPLACEVETAGEAPRSVCTNAVVVVVLMGERGAQVVCVCMCVCVRARVCFGWVGFDCCTHVSCVSLCIVSVCVCVCECEYVYVSVRISVCVCVCFAST